MNHVVIMAGGIGSRFWPMSTPEMPKQFIDIFGSGRTLIQMTADRFNGICSPDNIWIVTGERYVETVRKQLPEIPTNNILAEPEARNTAPCIAYACWKIKAKHPSANIVVTPSDALVIDADEFRRIIRGALDFTSKGKRIVTVGIKPTRPETGYGYIAAKEAMPESEICEVESFREKPDLATAKKYLADGNYLWNAGIFVWNVSTIVNAMRVYQPAISDIFENLLPYYGTPHQQEMINQEFPKCENISVDYAILEKAEEIFVFPASFGWSDLGTWGSLHGQSKHDNNNNVCIGSDIRLFETKNCLIHTTQEKKVVVQGLDGYIIAEKDNTLLICQLSEEQRIKQFSE